MSNVADTVTLNISFPVRRQLLRDLLCTAVEGGSNYWAAFSDRKRTTDLNYLSVRVIEHEASSDDTPAIDRVVSAEDLKVGLERLASAPFPAAGRHLGDALSENGDAGTADVVLQMTVFGELVYG